MSKSNILVFGAGGRTGFQVVTQALAAGHEVTGFVRDKSQLRLGDRRLTVKVGDARNVEDVIDAVKGHDVVISALGTFRAGDKLQARAMEALIPAMRAAKVKRVVLLSSLILASNYEAKGVQKLFDFALKGVNKDKATSEQMLKKSDLDWTIVYATALTNAEDATWRPVKQSETVSLSDKIARQAVATCLLQLADNRRAYRRSLLITGA